MKVFNTLLLSCCTSAHHIPLHPNQSAVKMKDVSGYVVLFLNLSPNDFNILREIINMPDKIRVDMRMSQKTQKYRLFCSRCNCHIFVTHLLIIDPDTDDTGNV